MTKTNAFSSVQDAVSAIARGAVVIVLDDEDRERETPRTFRASIEAMRLEGSLPVMVVFGMLALGLGVWAAIDLYDARMGYLRGALFHGYLELAVIGALFAQSGAGASRLRDLGSAA
jgi:hypothetical protein